MEYSSSYLHLVDNDAKILLNLAPSYDAYFPPVQCLDFGEKEMTNRTVNVRTRDNKVHGKFSKESVLDEFRVLAREKIIKCNQIVEKVDKSE